MVSATQIIQTIPLPRSKIVFELSGRPSRRAIEKRSENYNSKNQDRCQHHRRRKVNPPNRDQDPHHRTSKYREQLDGSIFRTRQGSMGCGLIPKRAIAANRGWSPMLLSAAAGATELSPRVSTLGIVHQ